MRAAHLPCASVVALAAASVAPCALVLGVAGSATFAKVPTAPGRGAPVGPSTSNAIVAVPPGGTCVDGGVAVSERGVVAAGGASSAPHAARAAEPAKRSAMTAPGRRRGARRMSAVILVGAPPGSEGLAGGGRLKTTCG